MDGSFRGITGGTPSTIGTNNEKFEDFIQKILSNASFQYSRIRFPLKNTIEYSSDDG